VDKQRRVNVLRYISPFIRIDTTRRNRTAGNGALLPLQGNVFSASRHLLHMLAKQFPRYSQHAVQLRSCTPLTQGKNH
jgi:hypothetical protein